MQAVIAIPPRPELRKHGSAATALKQEVAGVPLLTRVIATAMRVGVDSLLVIWPDDVDSLIWDRCSASRPLQGLKLARLWSLTFDPRIAASWTGIAESIEDHFLWLPWNWIIDERATAGLAPMLVCPVVWDRPALLQKRAVLFGTRVRVTTEQPVHGFPINSPQDVARAERFVIAHSGKPFEGVLSRFTRFLLGPVIRLLAHSRVKPDWVTLGALLAAILAAIEVARGSYTSYARGAILFLLSGLLLEMDGLLARLTLTESSLGAWFPSLAGKAACLLLAVGIALGLSR